MRRLSCLPGRGTNLCQVCGPNIDTENVNFSRRESNLVYIDKVYSYNQETASPLIGTFDSTAPVEITMNAGERPKRHDCCDHRPGCGCGCDCRDDRCTFESLGPDSVFNIERSFVLVESFALANPASLTANKVTIDGFEVDSVSFTNGQFVAALNSIIPEISKTRCQELGLPSKGFLLVSNVGPWEFTGTFVLEGTVVTGGRTCCFRARAPVSTTIPMRIPVPGTSTFAIPRLSLPCTVNGIAPTLNIQFSGAVSMLNPTLTVSCSASRCVVNLSTSFAAEPRIHTEVVRRTLFCLEACEALLPCDGTEEQFETQNPDEDCTWPPPPACRCGSLPSPEKDEDICERTVVCNFDEDRRCECEPSRPGHGFPGGCSCGSHERDERESSSGCSCSSCRRGSSSESERRNNEVSFQWSGCNGCSF